VEARGREQSPPCARDHRKRGVLVVFDDQKRAAVAVTVTADQVADLGTIRFAAGEASAAT
jgi:hypothetical protein